MHAVRSGGAKGTRRSSTANTAGGQIEARPTHFSPVAARFADTTMWSTTGLFGIRRVMLNEPLGAVVVREPENTRLPLSVITTFHFCPTRFESTSNSVSMTLWSGPSFSFQWDPALHVPRFSTLALFAPAEESRAFGLFPC